MTGPSKLGEALIIIFVISLVALLAELLYVLWRRRVFHRQTPALPTFQAGTTSTADSNSQLAASHLSTNFTSSTSKELLLYFFFLNSSGISRVEPTASTPPSLNSTEDEMEVIDVFKLQNMYGTSRVLFNIKEEDGEKDAESENSACSSPEKGTTKQHNTTSTSSKRVVNLEECFKVADDEAAREEAVGVSLEDIGGETPFSTPCESPSYFTPSASPTREGAGNGDSGEIETGLCTV